MGHVIAALLGLAGGYLLIDGLMVSMQVQNIMQQDYANARMIGGMTVFALCAILWKLSDLVELKEKQQKAAATAASAKPVA